MVRREGDRDGSHEPEIAMLEGVSSYTVLVNGWWERWEREWGEGGWMLVRTWREAPQEPMAL